ncbi:MAG: UDP-2,4-diacetamido-2,4,6-trideoxy-beta-L-altropyranose hydrolase [Lachnospiraceae bacterium]|nr:UDP-2,4-diacetamido-2,4,6-trideoxy-beta-L-altropyranose hydrolase [Lachnospiraceae bacterium]
MFYIRADANEIIGTGHVMRCLSIAEELRRQREKVIFLFADDRTKNLIEEKNFEGICLNSVWNDLDKETSLMKQLIEKYDIEKLLIDSYYVTEHYLEELNKVTNVIYIDDMLAFPYPVQVLINYNIFATEEKYQQLYGDKYSDTQFLLGCKYAPLRQEFQDVKRVANDKINSILISSGGTDTYNITGNFLCALRTQKWFEETDIHVIIGRFNKNKETLEKEWYNCKNVKLHYNIHNMSDYMKSCDIAVSAGGVTTYELCACGIPTIMYTLADNQLEIADIASDMGLVHYAGDIREHMEDCLEIIISRIDVLRQDVELRRDISIKMQQVVDGKGCLRLVKHMCVET